jgi:hypothetical protein
MDVFIHEHFFSGPGQVAFVDDPKGGDRGLFVWRRGRAVREEFLVDEDLGPQAEKFNPQPAAELLAAEEFHDVPAAKHAPRVPIWAIAGVGVGILAALVGFVVWWSR